MNDNIKNIMKKIKNFKLKQLLSFSGYFVSALIILNGYSFEFFQKTFGLVRGGDDGLMCFAYLIFSWFISLLTVTYYNTKKENIYKSLIFILFLFIQTHLYLLLFSYYTKLVALLNPLILFPLFISFLAITVNKRFYKQYLIIFSTVPLSLIIFDKIEEYKFVHTYEKVCEDQKPSLYYKSFQIPSSYFSNQEIKKEWLWDKKENLLVEMTKPTSTLFWNISCDKIDYKLEEEIVKKGYKVVCDGEHTRNYSEVNTIIYYQHLVGNEQRHYFFICGKQKKRLLNKIFRNLSSFNYTYKYPENDFIQGE